MKYSIYGLSKGTRMTIGAATLAASLFGNTNSALAQTANLVMSDMCVDPAAIFDYEWARIRHNSTGVFQMAPGGAVTALTPNNMVPFDANTTLYVAAHGNVGARQISGMGYDAFAVNLLAAHVTVPDEVFFGVCSSAVGLNSLLASVNGPNGYTGRIDKLSGPDAACALTGNGNPALVNADYRSGSAPAAGANTALYDVIQGNIINMWTNALYQNAANTYQEECLAQVAAGNQVNMAAFIINVVNAFSQPPMGGPDTSINYLDLVELNVGGNAFVECGADPAGNGVAVNCP